MSNTMVKVTTFFDALREVRDGKRITKVEWGDPNIYGLMRNGHLQIFLSDGQFHDWIVNDGDMNGLDWVVLD